MCVCGGAGILQNHLTCPHSEAQGPACRVENAAAVPAGEGGGALETRAPSCLAKHAASEALFQAPLGPEFDLGGRPVCVTTQAFKSC